MELWSGYVKNVVDGDTVDVSFNIYGIQRVRLVGIDTPEICEEGYEEAKEFVNKSCFELLFAIIGVLAAIYLIRQMG